MRARLIALAAAAILLGAPGASPAAAQSTAYPYYPGTGYGYPSYGSPGSGYSGYSPGWGNPAYSGVHGAQVFDLGPLGYAGYPSIPSGSTVSAYPFGYPYGYGMPGFWPGNWSDYGYPGSSSGYPVATPPSSSGSSTGRICILIYPPPPGC